MHERWSSIYDRLPEWLRLVIGILGIGIAIFLVPGLLWLFFVGWPDLGG